MNPYDEHADGLRELQSESPQFITWKGTDINVLPGTFTGKSANSIGGMALEADFAFACLAADFFSTPKSNEAITYRGKALKIDSVSVVAGGKQYRITANDASQKL